MTQSYSIMTILNKLTRKRFPQKPIVAFTNSRVFILDFYLKYMTQSFWSHVLALRASSWHRGAICEISTDGITCQEAQPHLTV